jgi:hypothetical protein
MAENKLDNTKLEAAAAEFVKDRQKEKYAGGEGGSFGSDAGATGNGC